MIIHKAFTFSLFDCNMPIYPSVATIFKYKERETDTSQHCYSYPLYIYIASYIAGVIHDIDVLVCACMHAHVCTYN